jgi:hypothetical protein
MLTLGIKKYAIELSEYQEHRHCTLTAAIALTKNQEATIALYSYQEICHCILQASVNLQ